MNQIGQANLSEMLDSENYDQNVLLNTLFPTEESLEGLSSVIDSITESTTKIDSEISASIRKFSGYGDDSKKIIENAKETIFNLDSQLEHLDKEAEETERVVANVCGSIKSYDWAKHNITSSITTLKRLQMASSAVSELEMLAQQKNYSECAGRILALTSLLEYFKGFEPNELISGIQNNFQRLMRELRSKILADFEQKLFGKVVDPSIAPACQAVDAYGKTYRQEIIEWFCVKFLEGYSTRFQTTPLSETDRRFNWLKQSIDLFNLDYTQIFPKDWRMQYYISMYFCVETKHQIKELLSASDKGQKPSVSDFQFGFEQTANFERVLADSFGSKETSPSGETLFKPASEFVGVIGSAFANYTDLYIQGEARHLEQMVQKAILHIHDPGAIDIDNRLLKSATELVQYMNLSIEKAGGFSAGNALFDHFFTLRDTIIRFCQGISQQMPMKMAKEVDVALMCSISNTTNYFCSLVDGLAKRIAKKVTEDQKSAVRVDDVKDQLEDFTRQQLKIISNSLCDVTRPEFEILSSGSWQNDSLQNVKFMPAVCKKVDAYIGLTRKWICDENFSALRTLFVPMWVDLYFDAAFGSGKPISSHGIEILSAATDSFKKLLIDLLVGQAEATASLKKKWISDTFKAIEDSLTVLLSNADAMPLIFLTLFKSAKRERFAVLLKAKDGMTSEVQAKLLGVFDAEVKKVPKG